MFGLVSWNTLFGLRSEPSVSYSLFYSTCKNDAYVEFLRLLILQATFLVGFFFRYLHKQYSSSCRVILDFFPTIVTTIVDSLQYLWNQYNIINLCPNPNSWSSPTNSLHTRALRAPSLELHLELRTLIRFRTQGC